MTPTDIYELRLALPRNGCHTTTQKELAALLGVSIQAVQAWEQGRRKPNGAALTLLKLLRHSPELATKLSLITTNFKASLNHA